MNDLNSDIELKNNDLLNLKPLKYQKSILIIFWAPPPPSYYGYLPIWNIYTFISIKIKS